MWLVYGLLIAIAFTSSPCSTSALHGKRIKSSHSPPPPAKQLQESAGNGHLFDVRKFKISILQRGVKELEKNGSSLLKNVILDTPIQCEKGRIWVNGRGCIKVLAF